MIGLLGILMVGTLVSLNPIQRFNQAKDANAKVAVDQASSAIQAYYASKFDWPASWSDLTTSGDLQIFPKGPDGSNLLINKNANGVSIGFESATSGAAGYYCWKSTGLSGHFGSSACTAP